MVQLYINTQQDIMIKLLKKMKFFYVTLVVNINMEQQMSQEQFVFLLRMLALKKFSH